MTLQVKNFKLTLSLPSGESDLPRALRLGNQATMSGIQHARGKFTPPLYFAAVPSRKSFLSGALVFFTKRFSIPSSGLHFHQNNLRPKAKGIGMRRALSDTDWNRRWEFCVGVIVHACKGGNHVLQRMWTSFGAGPDFLP